MKTRHPFTSEEIKAFPLFAFTLLFLLPYVAFAQQAPQVIPLWKNGAPGFEDRRNEPEKAKDWWVKNIHNPSITVYLPPKEKANGVGVLICPGGGHRALVYNSEGRDPALFLNSLGITAFVLKYRLGREENSPYEVEKHPKEDAYRAMRLIRSRANEWHLDPELLGMMGFSAGGEVVSMVAFDSTTVSKVNKDAIDQGNGAPDFIIMVYPGPIGIPTKVSTNAPPAFLVAANDDECCSGTAVDLLVAYRKAHAPVEGHFYAQGNHAFNMGNDAVLHSIRTWPYRLEDWLRENILPTKKQNVK